MSVPAHAPYHYIALRDLQEQGLYTGIRPKSLLTLEGHGKFPAKDAVERAGIHDQKDPKLESITQEIYSAEFARGKMHDRFGGRSVRVARDDITERMLSEFGSAILYNFDTRPVVCRCGGRVMVRILHDQWFLAYGDPAWKAEVHNRAREDGPRPARDPGRVRADGGLAEGLGLHEKGRTGDEDSPGTGTRSWSRSRIPPSTWPTTPSPIT